MRRILISCNTDRDDVLVGPHPASRQCAPGSHAQPKPIARSMLVVELARDEGADGADRRPRPGFAVLDALRASLGCAVADQVVGAVASS